MITTKAIEAVKARYRTDVENLPGGIIASCTTRENTIVITLDDGTWFAWAALPGYDHGVELDVVRTCDFKPKWLYYMDLITEAEFTEYEQASKDHHEHLIYTQDKARFQALKERYGWE